MKPTSLKKIKSLISDGWEITAPQQGISEVHKVMEEAMKLDLPPDTKHYFVQIVNSQQGVSDNKFLIFSGKESKAVVDEWRKSFIDFSNYKLVLDISLKSLSTIGTKSDLPIGVNLWSVNLTKDLTRKFGCEVNLDDDKKESFRLTYKTKSTSLESDSHLKEIANFENNLNLYLCVCTIEKDIGFSIESRQVIDPETFWTQWPPLITPQPATNKVDELYDLIREDDEAREIIRTHALINSQLSARAKIIIGQTFIESYLNDSYLNKSAFNLSKSQQKKLASILYSTADEFINDNAPQGGTVLLEQPFVSHIKSFLSRNCLSRKEVCLEMAGKYFTTIENVDQKIKALFDKRHGFAHKVRHDNEGILETIKFIDEVMHVILRRHLEMKEDS